MKIVEKGLEYSSLDRKLDHFSNRLYHTPIFAKLSAEHTLEQQNPKNYQSQSFHCMVAYEHQSNLLQITNM